LETFEFIDLVFLEIVEKQNLKTKKVKKIDNTQSVPMKIQTIFHHATLAKLSIILHYLQTRMISITLFLTSAQAIKLSFQNKN
jgi:hypothetical protein